MTEAGVILGTAAYMSPEQARGKMVDKRTDIWAFGCVLYEMLTGRRAFEGETVTDVLSAIVRAEPDWMRLPAATPAPVRRLLERCLQKDPTKRLRDIGDAHHLLSAGDTIVLGTSSSAAAPWWRRALRVGIAAVVAATAAGALAWRLKPDPAQAVVQFSVYPPEDTVFEIGGRRGASATISPDGRTLAFTARDHAGRVQLWLRPIESASAAPLAGTDGAAFPFWSPDSQHVAYFAERKLHRIAVAGGPPRVLADAPNGRGGAWGPGGDILFDPRPLAGSGLLRVASAGGSTSVVTAPSNKESDHRFPSFLPDGRHFFYFDSHGISGEVHIGALDGGDARLLVTDVDSGAVFSTSGHVLFTRSGVLLAQRFDPVSFELRGEPVPVGHHAWGRFQGELTFSVSDRGVLVYRAGNSRAVESVQLVWVDRQGTTIEQLADTRLYRGVDLAPDQRRLAFHEDGGNGGDVWVMDLARGTSSRLTFDGPDRHTGAPAWSPDGTTIAYATERNGTFALRVKAADGSGSESLLVESPNLMSEIAWSPDGRTVVYQSLSDIWALPLGGTPAVFHGSGETDGHPQVSPDGRWLAYDSDETGRPEVYIRPFPKGVGKWMVSTGGGGYPRWRGDSRELYYNSVVRGPSGGDLMSVELSASGVLLEFSAARRLFASGHVSAGPDGLGDVTEYAVARDGQRFLIPRAPAAAPASPAIQDAISVIVNWPTLLSRASNSRQ